jgi:hypothetical protein
VRFDLSQQQEEDGHLIVVLGPDGHVHPRVEGSGDEPATEVEAQRPSVDPTDPVVVANRERLEELQHERHGGPADMGDVVATKEGRLAAVGVALGLVARGVAVAAGAAASELVLLAGLLAFAVYKVPMWSAIACWAGSSTAARCAATGACAPCAIP